MPGGWNSWKDRRGNKLDGAKEKWKPVIPIVRAVVQFVLATGKLTREAQQEDTWDGEIEIKEMEDRVIPAQKKSPQEVEWHRAVLV